jgi:hypothetical protein
VFVCPGPGYICSCPHPDTLNRTEQNGKGFTSEMRSWWYWDFCSNKVDLLSRHVSPKQITFKSLSKVPVRALGLTGVPRVWGTFKLLRCRGQWSISVSMDVRWWCWGDRIGPANNHQSKLPVYITQHNKWLMDEMTCKHWLILDSRGWLSHNANAIFI